MARTLVNGLEIEYELLGRHGAPAVAITPGGRFSKDADGLHEMAQALAAQDKRVLLWDRPNCGASDISFEGASESKIQAQALIGLIKTLDLGPTALAGGSAGARVSIYAALHDPDAVSHLMLWWISGGLVSLMTLGSSYCCANALAASMGGMAEVAAMPAWTEQIARNPRNRDIILRQDPATFIARMEQWAKGFLPVPGEPLPGLTDDDYARLKMPVMIVRGGAGDLYHPAHIGEAVCERLPRSTLVEAPWDDDIFARRMLAGEGVFVDWPLLAPLIADFMSSS